LNFLLNTKLENLNPNSKIYAAFAISNLLHKEGKFKESAKYLKIANDESMKYKKSDLTLKIKHTEFYKSLKIKNSKNKNLKNSTNYIFIVGMPRCGSTLLESILSLNPEVQDLGEVCFLEEALQKTDDLLEVKNLYAEKVKLINSEKKIFTDKNLFNFLYCPVIYNFFPNARIIHCNRNPLDNILSIYRTNFLNQSFSSSLKDIADLYLYQMELMHEYKSKFESMIYSYDHDKVVQNPKENIKYLINWLGWEWSEKYLSPQKSKRSVFTASSAQVRKKINSHFSGYWKNYEDLLKPISNLFPKYN